MIPTKTAVLKQVTDCTHNVKEFVFSFEETLEFKPGQFVNFKVEDDQPGMCFRAYSIARFDIENKTFTLAVKIVPNGRGSNFLLGISEGGSVQFLGPVGNFCMRDSSKNIGLIATGTGIAPFISYLDYLEAEKSQQEMVLLWGVRHEKDIFYRDVLDHFVSVLPNFRYEICLSQDNHENCLVGRVSAHYKEQFESLSDADYYLCGSGKMIDQAKELLPQQLNVDPEQIFHEKFD